MPTAECPDLPGQVGGHVETVRSAPEGLPRGPRAIDREIEHGQLTAQLLLPVAQLALEQRPVQGLPLPGGEVGVLDRQRRWQRAPVIGKQLTQEHTQRPAVGDCVVNDHDQDVRVEGQPEGPDAQQRGLIQLERPPCLQRREPHRFC